MVPTAKRLLFSGSCGGLSLARRLHQFGIRAEREAGSRVPVPSEELALAKSANRAGALRNAFAGFSIVELVVSLCVMMILSAIAIPTLMRSLRAYQLNDAATRVSAMLKFARFEAVRRNKQINFLIQTSGTGYLAGTDSDASGNLDPQEKQELIAGFATLLPSGVAPTPTAILAALNASTLTPVSANGATITFDSHGAIRTSIGGGISNTMYVFYIGSVIDPDPGYRAVILLPSGSTQIWSAPNAGPWQKVG